MQVLQQIDWDKVVCHLPQGLRLRLLLTLLAVYRGIGNEQPTTTGGIYFAWVWNLLDGPRGNTLTQLGKEAEITHDSQASCHQLSVIDRSMMIGLPIADFTFLTGTVATSQAACACLL